MDQLNASLFKASLAGQFLSIAPGFEETARIIGLDPKKRYEVLADSFRPGPVELSQIYARSVRKVTVYTPDETPKEIGIDSGIFVISVDVGQPA